jgi:YfiH family protein
MYKYKIYEKYGIKVLSFDSLEKAGGVIHCFTTRKGGVSEGHCNSLNFSKSRDSEPSNVNENARRLAESLCLDYNKLTAVPQVHGCDVAVIYDENCGAGFSRSPFGRGYDAMITDVRGIPLMTLHGDCVPVFLYDPVRHAIGMVHSGWRGTAGAIVTEAVRKMCLLGAELGSIRAAIGPSIHPCCYEVDDPFVSAFEASERAEALLPFITPAEREGRYMADLQGMNAALLREAGVENVYESRLCTCCEWEMLFSHRGSGGKRGLMMAGIILP